jgi:hypothetical protein
MPEAVSCVLRHHRAPIDRDASNHRRLAHTKRQKASTKHFLNQLKKILRFNSAHCIGPRGCACSIGELIRRRRCGPRAGFGKWSRRGVAQPRSGQRTTTCSSPTGQALEHSGRSDRQGGTAWRVFERIPVWARAAGALNARRGTVAAATGAFGLLRFARANFAGAEISAHRQRSLARFRADRRRQGCAPYHPRRSDAADLRRTCHANG